MVGKKSCPLECQTEEPMKNDILTLILECLSALEEIPVKDTRDCYRKVQIHDRLVMVHTALSGVELYEKKEEIDGKDDTQTAD
jgi:hypothetical protein